jgi:hypothetical protein
MAKEAQMMPEAAGLLQETWTPFATSEERTQGSKHSPEEEAAARLLAEALLLLEWTRAGDWVALTLQRVEV